METGRKFRAKPIDELANKLAQWIGCARVVYNRKADEEEYLLWLRFRSILSPSWYSTGGLPEGESSFVFDQAYSHLKGDRSKEPWLFDVPSQIYRNAMYQRAQAWARFYRDPKNVGRPRKRKRGQPNSILLTNELFRWLGEGRIELGTKAHPIGVLSFHQHRDCGTPNSIVISHEADGRWWLSFNFDDGVEPLKPEQVLAELSTKSDEDIWPSIMGNDLGIAQTLTSSIGEVFGFDPNKVAKIDARKRYIRKLQRRLARQVTGSNRRRKTKRKIARQHSKNADLRNDLAHQISHAVVEHASAKVIVFEGLNTRGMVRRPKPVRDEDGKYQPNGAARKAGLNQSILSQSWGKIVQFSRYKARRAGKLVCTVDPKHTSQECSCCGHIDAANRLTQAEFHCQVCGHTQNADSNASAVIRKRAFLLILGVLGRRTDITPAEAATKLGLDLEFAASEPGTRSTRLAA